MQIPIALLDLLNAGAVVLVVVVLRVRAVAQDGRKAKRVSDNRLGVTRRSCYDFTLEALEWCSPAEDGRDCGCSRSEPRSR